MSSRAAFKCLYNLATPSNHSTNYPIVRDLAAVALATGSLASLQIWCNKRIHDDISSIKESLKGGIAVVEEEVDSIDEKVDN